MIGIPYRLLRTPDTGAVEKVVYLSTRRSGQAGESMKAARGQYRTAQRDLYKAAQRHRALARRVEQIDAGDDRLDQLTTDQEAAFDAISTAQGVADTAAENIVRLSLTANYGKEKAVEIMDLLTDDDFHDMVLTMQTGEQPDDFFPSPGQPGKPTSTSQPDASSIESSSSGDSPESRSSEEKSE